ncbi:MAG: RIP metalloprotease RseP [Clostridium sp.]|nr:RIP metalloprotease RseP [Clostridium sp.]
METILMKALQLMLALSLLVLIHEFGHYLFARSYGIRVDKFYMFFNPWFSLLKWRPGKYIGGLGRMKFMTPEAEEEYREKEEFLQSQVRLAKAKERVAELDKQLEQVREREAKGLPPATSGGFSLSDLFGGKKKEEDDDLPLETRYQKALKRYEEEKTVYTPLLEAVTRRVDAEEEAARSESKLRRFFGHSEYGLGWLPFGGYCAIAGMIDENTDTNTLSDKVSSWEFRSKPAWQRLLVMIGGVMFNFILAIIIYIGIAFHWGERYIELDKAYAGMEFTETARQIGFRNGDIPLLADGRKIDYSKGDLLYTILNSSDVTVLRDNRDTVVVHLPENFILQASEEGAFMAFRQPVVVDNVLGGEPASEAGLKEWDRIVAVDTVATPSYTELTEALQLYAGKPVDITVERDGSPTVLHATPTKGGKLGFQLKKLTDIYPTVVRNYTLFEAIPKGWEIGTTTLSNYVSSMRLVATKEGAKSVGGFGALGSLFPSSWSWLAFWEITAFLSVALAFMNFLPIPALDGGHIMFLLWEIISGRKVPEKVLETAQIAGMLFLLMLLLYANGNDIYRFLIK